MRLKGWLTPSRRSEALTGGPEAPAEPEPPETKPLAAQAISEASAPAPARALTAKDEEKIDLIVAEVGASHVQDLLIDDYGMPEDVFEDETLPWREVQGQIRNWLRLQVDKLGQIFDDFLKAEKSPKPEPPKPEPKPVVDPLLERERRMMPYVHLSRSQPELAELIESFGIRMRRPDRDVARDGLWLNEMAEGPDEGRVVYEIVDDTYMQIRRTLEPRRPLNPFEQSLFAKAPQPKPEAPTLESRKERPKPRPKAHAPKPDTSNDPTPF